MTHHPGYPAKARGGRKSGNSRNGKSSHTVRTGTTDVNLSIPRNRKGQFEPPLVKKHQRRLPGFDDKVLALYARGLTTRDIQKHLDEMYDSEVSPALITAVTDAVLEEVTAWQSRALDAVYSIMYLDGRVGHRTGRYRGVFRPNNFNDQEPAPCDGRVNTL